METLRKNQKEMLKIKNIVTEILKMHLMDSLADWSWPRKESANLTISQQKFSKLKCKEEKNIKELWRIFKKCNRNIVGIAERAEREEKKYLK